MLVKVNMDINYDIKRGNLVWGGYFMKRFSKLLTIVLGVMASFFMATSTTYARYPYAGMGSQECTVNSHLYTPYPSNSSTLTLPLAMLAAGATSSSTIRGCIKKITIKVDQRIDMVNPLIIQAMGTGNEDPESTGEQFVLIGDRTAHAPPRNGVARTQEQTLEWLDLIAGQDYDADGVLNENDNCPKTANPDQRNIDADSEDNALGNGVGDSCEFVELNASTLVPEATCAVIVDGYAVKMQNIIITNLPDGVTGVCVNDSDMTLENIQVKNGTNGIVVASSSLGATIKYNSGAEAITGVAVDFQNASDINTELENSIIPTNGDPIGTDENGFTAMAPGTETATFRVRAVGSGVENYIRSNHPVKVQIHRIDRRTDHILVEGAVVDASEHGLDDARAPIYPHTTRIQVYGVGETTLMTADEAGAGMGHNKYKGFFKYIGPSGDSGYGLRMSGVNQGFFKVKFPIDGETPQRVFFLPEFGSYTVGGVNKIITLGEDRDQQQIDCQRRRGDRDGDYGCANVEDDYGDGDGDSYGDDDSDMSSGDSDGDGDSEDPRTVRFGGNYYGFANVQECEFDHHELESECQLAEPEYDSDGDGLKDYQEDVNGNCRLDLDRGETDWNDPDSDDDGIPDGFGMEQPCPLVEGADACGNIRTCGAEDRTTADFDEDLLSNALDSDADNDGLMDGIEDRPVIFDQARGGLGTREGILYEVDTVGSRHSIKVRGDDGKDKTVSCQLDNYQDIGARYGLWKTFRSRRDSFVHLRDPIEASVEVTTEDLQEWAVSADADFRVEFLVCKNLLSGALSHNGNVDDFESSPRKMDTDDDGCCDGDNRPKDNSGRLEGSCSEAPNYRLCESHGVDGCRTVPDSTNVCNEIPCSTDKDIVLYGVQPRWVNWGETGYGATGYVDADNDFIPDVLQQKTADGKIDREAIKRGCFLDSDGDTLPDCVEHPTVGGDCVSEDIKTGLMWNKKNTDDDPEGLADNVDLCPNSFDPGISDAFVEGRVVTDYSCDPTKMYSDYRDYAWIIAAFVDFDKDGLYNSEEDLDSNGTLAPPLLGMNGIPEIAVAIGDGAHSTARKSVNETSILDTDTDDDGISDYDENNGVVGFVLNPRDPDSDQDGQWDLEEDHDEDGRINPVIQAELHAGSDGAPGIGTHDTHPWMKDSDGDGIDDFKELQGWYYVDEEFMNALQDNDFKPVPITSDPTFFDTDGDGLSDGEEAPNGQVGPNNSNPLDIDSDSDGSLDPEDICPLIFGNNEALCGAGSNAGGFDRDGDGLPDFLDPAPNDSDADDDHLKDGEEDLNKDGLTTQDETDPLNPDTDGDGSGDWEERLYGTDPQDIDSDDDCIPDGPMYIQDPISGQQVMSRGEDRDQNGKWSTGETNPLNQDTDGDGLSDGMVIPGFRYGEDLNCSGHVDFDPTTGRPIETYATMPDSDLDGRLDSQEVDPNNPMGSISNALNSNESCMSIAGSNGYPTSLSYFMLMLLGLTKWLSVRIRRNRK